MATSGSKNYNLVTNEIIEESFDICGIGSEGESISADMYDRARRSLNLIIKTWGANPHLWTRTEASVTLVASQATYALATLFSSKPMRVESVRRRVTSSSTDTPLMELSRQEYFDTPNKTTDSIPIGFYYDPQLTTGTLYVWPRPSTTTASTMTLQVTYLRRMDDFDGSADDADVPQEWLEALCYALAEKLAIKYMISPDRRAEITARAGLLYRELKGFDNEPASIFMQPDTNRC